LVSDIASGEIAQHDLWVAVSGSRSAAFFVFVVGGQLPDGEGVVVTHIFLGGTFAGSALDATRPR
jgi:hypothetical protein